MCLVTPKDLAMVVLWEKKKETKKPKNKKNKNASLEII